MIRTLVAPVVGITACALAACAGNSYGSRQPSSFQPIPLGDDLAITDAALPKHTIGAGYPDQLGHVFSEKWKADVAGYTQTHYSQTLGFPPGTKITITNLSKGSEFHTLNVIGKRSGPPAKFPSNPKLLMSRSGGDKLVEGYRSGVLMPGESVHVTLVKGNYLIGCFFHYHSDNMRDVVVVANGAKPGPHATPP